MENNVELDLSSTTKPYSPTAVRVMGERALSSQGQQISRTPPNCARCRNHEIIVPLRGHKRYCQYIRCECEKCKLTAERQKVMARQTAIRRAEEQDRQRAQKGLPVPGATAPQCQSPPPSEQDNTCSSNPEVSTPKPTPATTSTSNSTDTSKDAGRWDSILLLLRLCDLPLNTTPLLHIILTEVTSDANEVYNRFMKAQEELRRTAFDSNSCPLKEEVRRQVSSLDHLSPWSGLYYHPPTIPQALHQPTAIYKHASSYLPATLPTFRYHPYQVLPPPLKSTLLRSTIADSFSYSLHDSVGFRPSVLVPPDCYYKPNDLLDTRPDSPSRVHSNHPSLSFYSRISGSKDSNLE